MEKEHQREDRHPWCPLLRGGSRGYAKKKPAMRDTLHGEGASWSLCPSAKTGRADEEDTSLTGELQCLEDDPERSFGVSACYAPEADIVRRRPVGQ